MESQELPHIIAFFNALSVVALTFGYVYIKSGQRRKHRIAMVCALAASAAFLIVYLFYKANSGFAKFGGEGVVRMVYFSILIIHVIGAIAIAFMVPVTVFRAFRERFDAHRRIARYTWPTWMFVGISGVIVYVMAVHLYPYQPV